MASRAIECKGLITLCMKKNVLFFSINFILLFSNVTWPHFITLGDDNGPAIS